MTFLGMAARAKAGFEPGPALRRIVAVLLLATGAWALVYVFILPPLD